MRTIEDIRPITTRQGYFDHYYYFIMFTENYKQAYEITEGLLSVNFHGTTRYSNYDAFRKAKTLYEKNRKR